MANFEDLDELEKTALDPSTGLSVLQQLAQDYPSVRYLIALNPSTYPGLLQWLSQLADPQVTHALAQRSAVLSGEPYKPFDPNQPELKTLTPPKGSSSISGFVNSEPVHYPEEEPAPLKTMKVSGPIYTDVRSEPARPGGIAPINATSARTTSTSNANSSTTLTGSRAESEVEKETRYKFLVVLISLLVVGILTSIMVAYYFRFLRAQNPPHLSSAKPSVSASTPVSQRSLPPTSTSPAKDEQTPSLPPSTEATSPQTEPTPTSTPSSAAVEDPLAAPPGALKASSFVTPDGNVRCGLAGGSIECVINQSNLETNCEGKESAYQLTLTSGHQIGAKCVLAHNQNAQVTLKSGQAAAISPFSCQIGAGGTEVKCWNTSTGEGFKLSKNSWVRWNSGKNLPS